MARRSESAADRGPVVGAGRTVAPHFFPENLILWSQQ
jgi:hypothetical protein